MRLAQSELGQLPGLGVDPARASGVVDERGRCRELHYSELHYCELLYHELFYSELFYGTTVISTD